MKFNFALASFVATTLTAVSAAPAPEFKYLVVRKPNDPNNVQCVTMGRPTENQDIGDIYVIKPCDQLGNYNDARVKFFMDDEGIKTESGKDVAAWGIHYDNTKTSWMGDRTDASDQEKKYDWKNVGYDSFGNIFTDDRFEVDGCLSWQEGTNYLVFNNTGRNVLYEHTNESCAQFKFANLQLSVQLN